MLPRSAHPLFAGAAALLALALLLGGCGVDAWYFASLPSTGQGSTLVLFWSDSPLDGAQRLWVALDRVELLGDGPPVVLLERREEHDMLTLQNGARVTIGPRDVPAAAYRTLRLTFAPQASGRQRIEVGGTTYPLTFARPGGEILDVAGPWTVGAGEELRWVLDLNARLSVLEAASTFWLDPVVTVMADAPQRVLRGTVRGPGGLAVPGATASAQRAGLEVASARTRADGTFELGPLPPGSYALVATAPDHLPASAGVLVPAAGTAAPVELSLPAAGAAGAVDGTAPTGLTAGVVLVFQAGLFVAQAGVDPLTGAFALPTLTPGLYTFELHDASGPLDVVADQPVTAGALTALTLGP